MVDLGQILICFCEGGFGPPHDLFIFIRSEVCFEPFNQIFKAGKRLLVEVQSFRFDFDEFLLHFPSFIWQIHQHKILWCFFCQAERIWNDFLILFFLLFEIFFILFHRLPTELFVVLHCFHMVITGSNIAFVNFIKRFVIFAIHDELGLIVILAMILLDA